MNAELRQLQQQVEILAKRIAPIAWRPTYGYSDDGALPHLEVDSNGMHYVVVERGQEQLRRTTQEVDELLYWVFASITFSMASSYEVRHRIPNQDFRRLLFAKQAELLHRLNPAWEARRQQELSDILLQAPFSDTK